jgi:hypothetical protein
MNVPHRTRHLYPFRIIFYYVLKTEISPLYCLSLTWWFFITSFSHIMRCTCQNLSCIVNLLHVSPWMDEKFVQISLDTLSFQFLSLSAAKNTNSSTLHTVMTPFSCSLISQHINTIVFRNKMKYKTFITCLQWGKCFVSMPIMRKRNSLSFKF